MRMQVDTTDKDVLERFQHAVGAGRVYGGEFGYKTAGLGSKRVWKWTCSGSTAWAVANHLRPYLGARRLARLDEIAKELGREA